MLATLKGTCFLTDFTASIKSAFVGNGFFGSIESVGNSNRSVGFFMSEFFKPNLLFNI